MIAPFAPPGHLRRVVIRDVLNATARDVDDVHVDLGARLLDFCPPELETHPSLVVVHNGAALEPSAAAAARARAGDSVVFAVSLGGKQGSIGAIVGGIALLAGVGILTGGFGIFATPGLSVLIGKIGFGLALFGGATVLNTASQLLASRVKADTPTIKKDIADSPTYQVDGIVNTYVPGTPIAIPYGKERVGGHVIQQSLEVNDQGGSTLKMLVSAGHGPIQAIAGIDHDVDGITGDGIPTTIEINGSPAKNFKGVRVSIRLGTFNQATIPGFNEVVSSQSAGLSTLATAAPQTLTTSSPVEAFQVNIFHPAGLYKTTTTGAKQPYTVQYWLRWRETGNDAWFGQELISVTKNQAAAFSSYVRKNAPLGFDASGAPVKRVLDVQLERLTAEDSTFTGPFPVSTLQWNTLNEITSGDLSHPGLALVAFELTAEDQLQGSIPVVSFVREGKKVWVWDGSSTTNPVFSHIYKDGFTTKDDSEADTDGGWVALRAAVGPPITNERIGFRWTQSGTRKLNLVAMKIRRASTTIVLSGNLFVQIESDSAGSPSGSAVVTSQTVAASSVKAAGGLIYFAFTSPATLTHGTKYHAVLYGTYTPSATVNVQVGTSNVPSQALPPADLEYFTSPSWTLDTTRKVVGFLKFNGQIPGENPAWWLLDFLTNKIYGLGAWVTLDDIDLDALLAWANYCDECYDANGGTLNSFRWAGGLNVDFETSGWDLALKIAALGRAAITKVGRKIYIAIDRPTSSTQLFVEGNIHKDSVVASWLSVEDRPNRVEIQYRNEEISYNSDVAVKEDPDSLAAGDAYRTESVNIFGLTAPWRANRAAKYRINVAKNIKRTISFTAPIDAVALLPGDVFSFQHYLQDHTSYGGRVKSDVSGGTPTVIDIDRSVDLSSQRIKVRTKSSGAYVLQERNIASVSAVSNADVGSVYSQVTVTAGFTGGDLPKANDPYVVTLGTTSTRDYRCVALKASDDLMSIEVFGVEYNATVYNDDPGAVEEFTDTLPDPLKLDDAEDVANLTLKEVHQQTPDGSLRSAIEVGFDKPRGWNHVDVYWRDSNVSGGWTFAGSTWTSAFLITDHVFSRGSFTVAAVTVTRRGAQKAIDDAPRTSIFIAGAFCAPPDVTGFSAQTIAGTLVMLSWTAVGTSNPNITSIKDVAAQGAIDGYEIRQGASWSAGQSVNKLASGTAFVTNVPSPGQWTFWIVAKTRAGNQSVTPASVTLVVPETYQSNIVSRDESALNFPGTKTNCSVVAGTYLGGDAASAIYEFPTQTGLTLARYRIFTDWEALPYDTLETVAEWTWTIGSVYGDRRWVSGWNRNAFEPNDWVVGDSIGDFTLDSFFGRHWAIGAPMDVETRTQYILEYQLSTDGVGYTGWTRFVSGDRAVFQAVKIRLSFTGDAAPFITVPQQRALISAMKVLVVPEPMTEWGSSSLASGGSTVSFTVPFPTAPKMIGTIRAAAAGQNLIITNVLTTSFNAQVQTDAGAGVAKTIFWLAVL